MGRDSMMADFGWAKPEEYDRFIRDWHNSNPNNRKYRQGLKKHFDGGNLFVARGLDGEIIAHRVLSGTEASDLYVKKDYRGTLSEDFMRDSLIAHFERVPDLPFIEATLFSSEGRQRALVRLHEKLGGEVRRIRDPIAKTRVRYHRSKLLNSTRHIKK